METESIGFIITDPPYGIDFQSNRPRSKDPGAKKPKIANDKSPFIWWLYDGFRVLAEGGDSCVSAGGMFSRFSLTQ
jgi:site-specific DNA-methyltransferase (adenine-specific)